MTLGTRASFAVLLTLLILAVLVFGNGAGTAEEVYVRSFDSTYLAAYLRIPPGEGPHPAIMFIHGGVGGVGRELIARSAYHYVQAHLYAAGFAVFQMDYRRFDFGDVELEDIVAGYRYLQSRPEISRIGVIGGSHGGYLALMLATRVKPAATVSFAGLTDLRSMLFERVAGAVSEPDPDPMWRERRHHEGRTLREETEIIEKGGQAPGLPHGRGDREIEMDLAERWGDDEAVFKLYSPVEQVHQMNGPILYLVGSQDRLKAGGKKLIEKLQQRGHEAAYSEYPDMPHAFYWGIRPDPDGNLPTQFYLALKETTDFMRQWLKNREH